MKIISLFLLFAVTAFGAAINVQKDSGTNLITGPLTFGNTQTLTFASGSSLTLQSGSTLTLGTGTVSWSALTGQPTTLAGYGITDPIVLTTGSYPNPSWITTLGADKLMSGTMSVSRLPALTGGDVTSSAGSGLLTLGTSGITAQTYGSGTAIPVIAFDAKGRATSATTATLTPVWSNITGTPTSAAGYGIVNGANIDLWGTKTAPAGAPVGTTDAQALSGKSYDGLTFATSTGFTVTGGGKTLTVGNTASVSGTNTGDQTITLTGDATGSGTGSFAVNVGKLNGVSLAGLSTGILKNNTTTGIPSIAVAGTDYEFPTTFSTGLTRSSNTVTVNTSQNIAKLSNLTTNGFVKTGSGDGTLSVDTSTYLTGNQTITISGDVTGSGSTAITATLANIPSGTPAAGSMLHTAIAPPSTPAAGKASVYVDSTSKNLAVKNDAGTVNHGVQTRTATANNWIRSIADDGSSTISQPAFTDISGSVASTQMPALIGDTTTSAGTTLTTVGKVNGVTYGTSPSTNTVPVVTGTNAITYETVPNSALANSAITIQGSSVALGGSTLATNSTPQFARVGLGAAADSTAQVLAENDTLGATSTDGIILKNATAATAGNQKWSPRIHYVGQGWKTNATAGSQTVDFINEMRPVQGTANPSGLLAWGSQINGGGYLDQLTLDSSGNLTATGNLAGSNLSLGGLLTTTAARTLDQDVATTSSPTFNKINVTGTAQQIATFTSTQSAPFIELTNGTIQGFMQTDGGSSSVAIGSITNHPVVLRVNNTQVALVETGAFSVVGSILSSSASGGVGYTTGAGGTVTQITSRSTGVTVNTVTGAITGNSASLAAQTAVTFTVTDSACGANDVPHLALKSGGSVTTAYYISAVAAGSFNITLFNENTITADTTTPVINFVIIKGSSS